MKIILASVISSLLLLASAGSAQVVNVATVRSTVLTNEPAPSSTCVLTLAGDLNPLGVILAGACGTLVAGDCIEVTGTVMHSPITTGYVVDEVQLVGTIFGLLETSECE